MPNIELIKLTIRRGTDAQRKQVVLEQGEIGFTTDHKRLWVGDGILSGGNVIGAKLHSPIGAGKTNINDAQIGDAVYENSFLYQLTASDYSTLSSWGYVGNRTDDTYIQFNPSNKLTLVNNSIDGNKFARSAAFNAGGLTVSTNYGLSVVPDNTTIEVANSAVRIKDDGVNQNKIISTTINKGLKGGSGTVIEVDANPAFFGFAGTTLTLSALPAASVTFAAIDPSWVGDGLTYDGTSSTIKANLSGVNSTLSNSSGVIGLNAIGVGTSMPWATITQDNYGRVTNLQSTVMTALTCNTTQAVVSAFNGYPGQVSQGSNGVTLTTFTVLSSNGNTSITTTLSSAGFIAIDGFVTGDGKSIDRVAIPVFTY